MLKVNFNYIKFNNNKSKLPLLQNISFTLNKNNIYTIVGKNGSGKSTILMAIIKMLDDDFFEVDGSVLLEETDLYSIDNKALMKFRSENFRFVFQDPVSAFDPLKKLHYYFSLTSASEDIIEEELKFFQLQKYSEIKKFYPHELSVGMLQRVNIILAIIANPKILILDEPTSALDLPIMNLLKIRLKKYVANGNGTVLLVTQDIKFVKHTSNFIAELSNGKLSNFLLANDFFNEGK